MRSFTIALATAASLMLGGAALAQKANSAGGDTGANGETSGSANGANVMPSTAVQKNHRSSSDGNAMSGSAAGGAPGVSGPSGSENGPAPTKGK